MATLIKIGDNRINLDNVTHVQDQRRDEYFTPGVWVFFNVHAAEDQAVLILKDEEAAAFLFVWDRMAVNALRKYREMLQEKTDEAKMAADVAAYRHQVWQAMTDSHYKPAVIDWCMDVFDRTIGYAEIGSGNDSDIRDTIDGLIRLYERETGGTS